MMLSAATNWTSTGFGGGGGFFDPAVSPSSTTSAVVADVPSDVGPLFQTTNSGGSWSMINYSNSPSFVANPFSQVQFSSGGVEYVAGGVGAGDTNSIYKSTNGGVSWSYVADNVGGFDQLIADPNNNENLYISINNSVDFSTNGGTTFTALPTFTPDPNNDSGTSSYGAWVGGIFSYTPSGGSEIIYLATNNENGNLYESTNGGSSFSIVPISGGLALGDGTDIHSFACSLASGSTTPTLYALPLGAWAENGYFLTAAAEFPHGGTQLYTLSPNGSSFEWTAVGNALPSSQQVGGMTASPTNPNIIYLTGSSGVTTSNGNGTADLVLASTLSGGVWTGAWTSVYDPGGDNSNVSTGAEGDINDYDFGQGGYFKQIVIDPLNPQIVVTNNEDSVFLSTNGGSSWAAISSAQTTLNAAGTGSVGTPYATTVINDTAVWSADFLGPTIIDNGQSDMNSEQTVNGGADWELPTFITGLSQRTIDDYGGQVNAIYNTAYDPGTGLTYGSSSDEHDLYDPSKSAGVGAGGGALAVSSDLGHTWSFLAPPNQTGNSIQFQNLSGGTLGTDWYGGLRYVYVDPNDPTGDTVYAAVFSPTSGTVNGVNIDALPTSTEVYAPGGSNTNNDVDGIWVTHNIQAGDSATWYQLPNPTSANNEPFTIQVLSDNTLVVTFGAKTETDNAPGGSGVYYLPGSLNAPSSTYSTVGRSSWVDVTPTTEGVNITGLPSGSASTAADETLGFTVDPSDSTQNTWFLSTGTINDDYAYSGVWKTTNRGQTWTLYWNESTYGDGFGGASGVAINPGTDEMYIATANDGMFYTSNYNAASPTFSQVSGFPFWSVMGGVEFDPYNPSEVLAMTEGGGLIVGNESTGNPAPSNFNVTANNSSGAGAVDLTWTDSDPNATYEIDYVAVPTDYGTGTNLIIGNPGSGSAIQWTAAATVNSNTDGYILTAPTLTPGVQYAFRVVAVDSGVRTSSTVLPGAILPAPTNLVATGVAGVNGAFELYQNNYYDNLVPAGTPQIEVTWTGLAAGNTDGVTGYLVQYSTNGETWYTGKDESYFGGEFQAASGQFYGVSTTNSPVDESWAELNSSGQYTYIINSGLALNTGYYIRVTPIAPSPSDSDTQAYDSVAFAETVTATPTAALSRTAWTATDSTNNSPASNAIDGDPKIVVGTKSTYTSANETTWTTDGSQKSGYWFQVNMGSAQAFDEVTMTDDQYPAEVKNNSGNAYEYSIEVSNTSSFASGTYTTVLSDIANAGGLPIDATFAPVTDQYIRVVLDTGNGNWWNIDELNVYSRGTVPALGPLPTGWLDSDVGSPGVLGSASYNSTTQTYTVSGNGADLWYQDPADQYHYAYTTLAGNGQIVAEVNSQLNTGADSKVGLLITNGLAPYSQYALVALDQKLGALFETANVSTTSNSIGSNSAFSSASPEWLQLDRTGNVFTAYASSNGTTWIQLGSTTISNMNGTVDIGLAVESNSLTTLNTGLFTNVNVSNTTLPNGGAVLQWIGGASGAWDTTSPDWFDGLNTVAWRNGDTAVFNGTAASVTIAQGAAISAAEIEFTTTGYSIAAGSGGSLAVGGSGTIDVAAGISDTIAAPLVGSGGLTLSDSGTLLISAANWYTGATEIEAGTLQLGNPLALRGSTAVGALSAGTLDLNGQAVGSGVPLDNFAGTLTNSNSRTATFAAPINPTTQQSFTVSGTGGITLTAPITGSSATTLTKTGSNRLSLDDTAQFDGLSLLEEGGSVDQDSGGASYTSLEVDAGLIMTIDPAGGPSLATILYWDPGNTGATSGPSGGGGVWNTSTADWYNPDTRQDQAWNNGGQDTAIFSGSSGTVSLASGISADEISFQAGGYSLQNGTLATGGDGISVATNDTDTIDSTLDGSLGLIKDGQGTLIVGGSNDYTGQTGILYGTLTLAGSTALGDSSGVSSSPGATLDLNGQSIGSSTPLSLFQGTLTNSSNSPSSFAATINYNANFAIAPSFTVAGAGQITLSGAVDGYGTGTLTKNGNNTLVFSGTSDDVGLGLLVNSGAVDLDKASSSTVQAVTAGLAIVGGTVQFGGSGSQQVAGAVAMTGGTLDLNGFNETVGTITGSGVVTNTLAGSTATLTVGADNGTGTYSGAIQNDATGIVALAKSGSGIQFLTGTDSYTGGTAITSGTLQLGNGVSNGSIGGNIADGGALVFDEVSAQGYSGAISGTGSVAESGASSLTLTAANSYTGATTVTSGALILGVGGSLGNTAISVSAGAAFDPRPGSGTASAGSTGSGNSGAKLTLASGSTFDMTDGSAGTFDLSQQTGFSGPTLTLQGATLNFDLGAAAADQLETTGAASVSGVNIINIVGLSGGVTQGQAYPLISAASGLTGTFEFSNGTASEILFDNNQSYTLQLSNSGAAETLTIAAPPNYAMIVEGAPSGDASPAASPASTLASTPAATFRAPTERLAPSADHEAVAVRGLTTADPISPLSGFALAAAQRPRSALRVESTAGASSTEIIGIHTAGSMQATVELHVAGQFVSRDQRIGDSNSNSADDDWIAVDPFVINEST